MSVEDEGLVDIIAIDKSDSVVLTVSDHLDWSDPVKHQSILQAKLNRYLAFVESGELLDRYPAGRGRRVKIKVVFKFAPDALALEFLSTAQKIIEAAGFTLQTTVFTETHDSELA